LNYRESVVKQITNKEMPIRQRVPQVSALDIYLMQWPERMVPGSEAVEASVLSNKPFGLPV
jgi:hypothetical protein